ncbi:hypothetical protein [Agromyces sp. GXQ0307]|uniref:hypothetical protein n=1 Tax=Agromyces sp. GXQ0307 TaxID=3377835 RepID=UPI003839FA50
MRAKAADDKRRRLEVERVGEWAKQNPEKRREARERYKEQNPEKYRAAQREYYHRNKEAIAARRRSREGRDPEKLREARRQDAARRKESADRWTPSEEQREKYRAHEREKKQLERRLQSVGLPSRRVRRTLVSERRANLAAAEQFFSRRRSRAEVRRIAAGDVDPNLLQGWARYSALVRRRNAFLDAVQTHIRKHGDELRDDVTLDSRARELVGKDPLDTDAEVRRRALEAVRVAYAGMAPPKPSATSPARIARDRLGQSRAPHGHER